jgi:transcriptional regulator with XRE-family HTH domain
MPFQHATTPDAALELRRIRTFLGWTQATFADAMGTSPGAISAWETGAKPVPVLVVRHARFLAQARIPRTAFMPTVPDAPQQRIYLTPGSTCHWQGCAQIPCGGLYLRFEYQVSRRRHLTGMACERHLDYLYDLLRVRIAEKERLEALRQRGTLRKRRARQRAREAATTPPTS